MYPDRAETYPDLIVPLRKSHPITAIARLEMISPHTMWMYPLRRGDWMLRVCLIAFQTHRNPKPSVKPAAAEASWNSATVVSMFSVSVCPALELTDLEGQTATRCSEFCEINLKVIYAPILKVLMKQSSYPSNAFTLGLRNGCLCTVPSRVSTERSPRFTPDVPLEQATLNSKFMPSHGCCYYSGQSNREVLFPLVKYWWSFFRLGTCCWRATSRCGAAPSNYRHNKSCELDPDRSASHGKDRLVFEFTVQVHPRPGSASRKNFGEMTQVALNLAPSGSGRCSITCNALSIS